MSGGPTLEGLGRVTTIVHSMKEFARPDLNRAIPEHVDGGHQRVQICGHVSQINQVILNIIVNAAHAGRGSTFQVRLPLNGERPMTAQAA